MLKKLLGLEPSSSTLIDAAFNDVRDMLEQSGKMLDYSLASLLDNQELSVDLEQMDDSVDNSERMVRRSVLEHLSFNPQQDLVASLVLVSMVQDAERIGDSARGLAELIPLAGSSRGGEFADRLKKIAGRIRPLFDLCSEAFQEESPDKGREVVAEAAACKQQLKDLVRDLASSSQSADMAVVYSGAARILRRTGAHLSNIASSVVQPYDRIRHGDEEA
ncbi:MAG: hypothetical protein K0U98_28025 [Deltaproteobacteria bacterium]|nr:hypothetical protein [Deltaproteobacteria bacterium]